jgi:very-short-patch-repair endonuclease
MAKREPRVARARRLRSASSDAETKLWLEVKDRRLRGLKFRRQHPWGPYTLDLYCVEAGLVVEAVRTERLERQGLFVLRFWNNEVLQNLEGCLERIAEVANERLASLKKPSPQT